MCVTPPKCKRVGYVLSNETVKENVIILFLFMFPNAVPRAHINTCSQTQSQIHIDILSFYHMNVFVDKRYSFEPGYGQILDFSSKLHYNTHTVHSRVHT